MRRLIVDGYNLLHSSPRYAEEAARDVDAARAHLIADLGARAAEGQDVVVVFDGAGNPSSDGAPHAIGGITVIFSPSGSDADSVIESLAASARAAGEETEIVTSDGATRWTSVGGPVTVTRASTFGRELEEDDREWREHRNAGRSRGALEDRISPETRRRLDRMTGRGDRPSR